MAYDFQRLADVELLEEVPDGAICMTSARNYITTKRVIIKHKLAHRHNASKT